MIDFSAITRKSKLLGRIFRTPLNIIPKDTVVPIMQGLLRGKRWIVGASLHSFWLGSYEIDKQKIMAKHIKEGDVFYDIGANVGFYTLFAAYLVKDNGHVYAFEPFPQNAAFAEKHIKLNDLKNATLFKIAVADHDGTTHFQEGASDGMGKIDPDGNFEVPVATLDTLIEKGILRPATILKIDVEGGEHAVLKGAVRLLHDHKPRIFLATHGDEPHTQCVNMLTELGYQMEAFRSIDGGGEILAY